jgi:hypothetical protein
MLSKCANPACSTPFRYLSEGKLYLIDSKAALARHGASAELKRRGNYCSYEYFWLCPTCCRDMTIQIDHNLQVRVARNRVIQNDSAPDTPAARDVLRHIKVA